MRPVNTKVNSKFVLLVLHTILWVIILALSAYILYCYSTNRFDTYSQAIVTSAVLLTITCLLIITRAPRKTLLGILIVAHVGVLVTWGNIVPFITLVPLFLTFLLVTEGYTSRVKQYLILTLIINLVEIVGVTPIVKQPLIEIGLPNLIVTTVLQSITYFIWAYMLRLYSVIAGINFFGLESTPTSPSFLRATLAKGLFMSLLLHYLNNLMNGAIWNTPADSRKLETLRLLGESERSDAGSGYTVGKVVGMAGITASAPIATVGTKKLDVHQAKVLFLLLANIEDNYKKYTTYHTCKIAENRENGQLAFTFVGKPKPEFRHVGVARLWGRNLGTIRQYVELVGNGSLEVSTEESFLTVLTYKSA